MQLCKIRHKEIKCVAVMPNIPDKEIEEFSGPDFDEIKLDGSGDILELHCIRITENGEADMRGIPKGF